MQCTNPISKYEKVSVLSSQTGPNPHLVEPHEVWTRVARGLDLLGLVPFGVSGMINPPTSSVPELTVELYEALIAKEYGKPVEAQAKVTQVTQMFISTQKKYGRGTIAETYRLRGLPVKRFPRWETAPLPEEAIAAMRQVYVDVGVLN